MKTIFSDFDGTITTEKGELLPSTITQIYKLSKLYDIILVTGRPVAWGELILSCFPIKAVIAENGYCCLTSTKKYYPFGEAKNQQKIIKLINDNFNVEYSSDQKSRESDIAIELNPYFYKNQTDILNLIKDYRYKISNIHLNIWEGDYNKGEALKWYIEKYNLTDELFAIGDSPNDQPMFDQIKNSYHVKSLSNFSLNTMTKINEYGGIGFNVFSNMLLPPKFAYVTLVTSEFYVKGALVLIYSLKKTTDIPILVMVPKTLDDKYCKQMSKLGACIEKVDNIEFDQDFINRHSIDTIMKNVKPYTATKYGAKKSKLAYNIDNFMKLKLWQFTQYEKLAYLDADMIVLRNMDSIFKYDEFSVATNLHVDLKQLGKINSGVFVAKPSQMTYNNMITTLLNSKTVYPRTDQTFLEEYFKSPYILPHTYNCLQYLNCISKESINFEHIFAIHYIIDKPWDNSKEHHPDLEKLHTIWWGMYNQIQL